jgi:phage recombination protein Bet
MSDTKTAAATKPAVATESGTSKGDLAVFSPPRLPFHPAIEERFGIDKGQWKALVEAVFPAAQSVDAVALALSYCKARKLDPFKRVVHIVPIWDRNKTPGDKPGRKGGYVETVWPGIAEHRTTATRTKQHAGLDPAKFGPMVDHLFELDPDEDGTVRNLSVRFPEWCEITVYRLVDGQRCPFPGPKVYWLEIYSRKGASKMPNEKWMRSPVGMLEKCAEAAALRRAFPEEIGDEPTVEEAGAFAGREHDAGGDDMPPRPTRDQFATDKRDEPAQVEADFEEVDQLPFEWINPEGEVTPMTAEEFAATMREAIAKAKPDRMPIIWENNSGQIAKLPDEKVRNEIRDAMDTRTQAEARAAAQKAASKPNSAATPTADREPAPAPSGTSAIPPAQPAPASLQPTPYKLAYGPEIDLARPAPIPVPPKSQVKGEQTKAMAAAIMHIADLAPFVTLEAWFIALKPSVEQLEKISPTMGANIRGAFQRRWDAAQPKPQGDDDEMPEWMGRP